MKKGVLKNFTNFLCWSLFLTNLWAFRPATLFKKIQNRCFPEKFAKFLRTPILKNICEQLLLFRIDLTNSVKTFVVDFESLSDCKKVEILLYGDSRWDDNKNYSIFSAFINWLRKLNILILPFLIYSYVYNFIFPQSLTLLWLWNCVIYVVFLFCEVVLS